MKTGLALISCLLVIFAAVASADTVILTNGSELEGKIVEETPSRIVLELSGGRLEIPRQKVRSIQKDETSPAADQPQADADELAGTPPRVRRPPGTVLLLEAARNGRVQLRIEGRGIASVLLTVTATDAPRTPFHLPAGARLVPIPRPGASPAQVLLVVKSLTLPLPGPEWSETVEVVCAERTKRVPDKRDEYRFLDHYPENSDLGRLAPLLASWDFGVRQAAVWITTDDADRDDLHQLQWSRYDLQSHRMVRGRLIGETPIAAALMLCERAGIDVERRRAWADRRSALLAAATPVDEADELSELCIWARVHLREIGYVGSTEELVILGLSSERNPELARHLADVVEKRVLHSALPILDRLLADKPAWLANESYRLVKARATLLEAPAGGDSEADARVEQVTALLERLRRPKLAERRVGIDALESLESEIRIPSERGRIARALLAVLEYGEGVTDLVAARCLFAYRDALDLEAVLALSRSPAAETRKVSTRLLEKRLEAAAVTRLREMVDDPGTCTRALGALRSRPEELLTFAGHRNPEVRLFVLYCATAMPESAKGVEVICGMLRDGDPRIRRVAVDGVARVPGEEISDTLTKLLASDPDPQVRMRAGVVLAERLGGSAIPELQAAVERAETRAETRALETALKTARRKVKRDGK